MTKTELYSDYLTQEGYRPSLDKDGDLTFKHERINFILFANEKDEEFFKLMIPFFWPIESEEERERAGRVMHRLNAEYKAAKFYPIDDDVCVCVECFFETPDTIIMPSQIEKSTTAEPKSGCNKTRSTGIHA